MLYEQQNRIYLARRYHAHGLNMRLACCTRATGNEMACYTSCRRDWTMFHRPPLILAGLRMESKARTLQHWNMLFSILYHTADYRPCRAVVERF